MIATLLALACATTTDTGTPADTGSEPAPAVTISVEEIDCGGAAYVKISDVPRLDIVWPMALACADTGICGPSNLALVKEDNDADPADLAVDPDEPGLYANCAGSSYLHVAYLRVSG